MRHQGIHNLKMTPNSNRILESELLYIMSSNMTQATTSLPANVPQLASSQAIATHPIIDRLRGLFTDLFDFEQLVLPSLWRLISRPPVDLKINTKHILTQNGIDKGSFVTKEHKKLQDTVRIVLCCAYVLLYETRLLGCGISSDCSGIGDNNDATTQQNFLEKYLNDPKFQSVYHEHIPSDRRDVPYMVSFWKYLKLSLELLPGQRNKGLAIQIAGRLEGSNEIYVLGSGQRDAATRREIIYHTESGTPFPTKSGREDGSLGDSDIQERVQDASISRQNSTDELSRTKRNRDKEESDGISISSDEKKPRADMGPSSTSISRESSMFVYQDEVYQHEVSLSQHLPLYCDDDIVHEALMEEFHIGFTETVQSINF